METYTTNTSSIPDVLREVQDFIKKSRELKDRIDFSTVLACRETKCFDCMRTAMFDRDTQTVFICKHMMDAFRKQTTKVDYGYDEVYGLNVRVVDGMFLPIMRIENT